MKRTIPILICSILLANGGIVAAEAPPNFIFILSDDVCQGDLGCYGQELIQTPHLDRLAAEGTRYTQAYCGTTVCAPSRSSFYTGLHSGHCPVRANYQTAAEGQFPIPAEYVTMGEVAKAGGYATATFGKWGMGFFDTEGSPLKQGMDHFFGYNCQVHAHSYFPRYLYNNEQGVLLPGNDGLGIGKTYAQEVIQRDLIRWLKRNGKTPFFLFYAITLPHGRQEIDDLGIYADKPWSDKQKTFAAQVTRLDKDVGELVATLRELGVDKNTLVVFSGDNGSAFGPKSEITTLFKQDRHGLRGFKRGMYEGALRQASIAWWPGTVPAGRVSDEPWAFWDLMPTFVEMGGITPPDGYKTDGHSLLGFLKGGKAPPRDYFYWELHEGGFERAARWGDWKAVMAGTKGLPEIYDLAKDPGEKDDLAEAQPELVKRAEAIFAEAHAPHPDWPLTGGNPKRGQVGKEASAAKLKRDEKGWVPPNAIPLSELYK